MATRKTRKAAAAASDAAIGVSSTTEDLLLAALKRGDEAFTTGRYLITYRTSATRPWRRRTPAAPRP
jgi:hypothetical protein